MSSSDPDQVARRRELRKQATTKGPRIDAVAQKEPDVSKRYPQKRAPKPRALKSVDWADLSVNVITGCRNYGNKHICGNYCYAHDMALRQAGRNGYPEKDPFRPTFHPNKLKEINWNHAKPMRIFLNSMSDWFCEEVDPDWVMQILNEVSQNKTDKFLVLTKRPEEIPQSRIPTLSNVWWGVSICRDEDAWRSLELRKKLPGSHIFASFEPLLERLETQLLDVYLEPLEWIIIGAETGKRKGKVIPKTEWITDILEMAGELRIPVFLKNNLSPVLGNKLRQDYPAGLITC